MTIAAGMQLHWTRLAVQAGVVGTWIRSVSTFEMTLVLGQSTTETQLDTGISVESKDQDFIGHCLEFITAVGSMPEEFDKFEYVDQNGETKRYEVVNPAGVRPWEYSDPTHVMFRVHCEEVED